jgi:sugar phosphate isomerase/epimerase
MLIGAMNNPALDLLEQIHWMGKSGLGFIDLTLEPPGAASWSVDCLSTRDALKEYNLGVVGHTAPYLPIASPIEELRRAAIAELRRCVEVFHALGARWMNIHPSTAPMHDRRFTIEKSLETLRELLWFARDYSVGLMIENAPGHFNTAEQLAELLNPFPELGLHLDIGHTNLMTPYNTEQEILDKYARRVKHVHCHDNKGGDMDLHLPLGAGTINTRQAIQALKSSGYDGTITLEVFTSDPNLLLYSRDVLKRTWEGI